MKKSLFFLIVIFLLSSACPAVAALKFKDMPEDHWAARSVYNVVRLGITRGYPDGTFRGEKTVNRYELMVYLSNLAIALEKEMDEKIAAAQLSGGTTGNAATSKVLGELRAEVQALRQSILTSQQGGSSGPWDNWTVTGDYAFRANFFSVSDNETETKFVGQRARLTLGRTGPNNGVAFEVDTGYVNPAVEGLAANITRNVLAVTAWADADLWGSTLRAEASGGPGDFELNDYPSNSVVTRSGTVVYRPGNAVKLAWSLAAFELTYRYEKRLNNKDRLTGKLGYTFDLAGWDLGKLFLAIGAEEYSGYDIDGYLVNSPRTIYELAYRPWEWLDIFAQGSRLYTWTTEVIEYHSKAGLRCTLASTDTEFLAQIDRLSSDFYVDNVSDEIAGVNILGYRVLPEFEAVGGGIKQNLFDKKIYIAGYGNTSTSMLDEPDEIHLFQETASQWELGWNMTEAVALSFLNRNTNSQLMNDPEEIGEIVDHIISARFSISF